MKTSDSQMCLFALPGFGRQRWKRFLWDGLTLLLIFGISPADAQKREQEVFASTLQPAFETHCVKCHGKNDKVKGDVNLLALKSGEDLLGRPDLLDKLIVALDEREMPPKKEPPLDAETREGLIRELKTFFKQSVAEGHFAPIPIRRMNRFQYNNAVVDLLDLKRGIFALPERLMRRHSDYFQPASGKMPDEVVVDSRPLSKDEDGVRAEGFFGVAAFPRDLRAEHGYDNRADHLTLSPLLMESFLRLSQTIVGSKDLNPKECGSWVIVFEPPAEGDQVQAVRDRLAKLLRRAFRRPVDEQTLERFVQFAQKSIQSGTSFTDTMKTVVGAALASPEFIYLYDAGDVASRKLDDFELASRLSFFLWGSIPDDPLLDLAEAGKLSDPVILNAQLDRMLNDRRIERFCDSFPSQWLQLDRLISSIPDAKKFGQFYFNNDGYRASMHMMMEPLLLFETLYIENRSIVELLKPDFTWTSSVLNAAYAGGDGKSGDVLRLKFRKTPVRESKRGGVITCAAVMTMTSSPVRTLPITRGAWVNAVIFNDPPDPPPADVPPLPEADEEVLKKLTIRERFAEHRKREDCASCHKRIDPLGFALENYGPTGVWRDTYDNGRDVDPSGTLFNQYEFKTAREFQEIILAQKHRFIRGFAAHLLSYSLGRKVTVADSPPLDKITERAMAGDDKLRDMLKLIAQSKPFHQKATQGVSGHEK